MTFPAGFTWGAATASYQIEGAVNVGGRGASVWDHFCRWDGKIFRGHTGDVSCNHYHRYKEDVWLMREIGLNAYRFSIAWPRIQPEGTGPANLPGLDFYDRLVDELLGSGVTPWVTLYHWDLPLALHYQGGWLNRDIAHWFEDYARIVVGRLSDRVSHWFTLNEPQVFVGHGYHNGTHAPGLRLPESDCLRIVHHSLLAHGRAATVIRQEARTPARMGWAPVGYVCRPETESEADIQAARDATFEVRPRDPERVLWNGAWYNDPVFEGRYPEAAWELDLPFVQEGDMEIIHQVPDFFGANIYVGSTVRATPDGGFERVEERMGSPRNTYGWDITPDVLYWAARFYHERYARPIVITENGIPTVEWPDADGRIPDAARAQFLDEYLRGIQRALDEDIPFEGYFYWTLMDNFEWNEGYRQRFGLVHVDYETGTRTLKDSAYHLGEIIRSRGASLDTEDPAEAEP